MLNETGFLYQYIIRRAESPLVMTKLSESDVYTMGYVDGLAEVLSVLRALDDLMEEYEVEDGVS